MGNAVAKKKGGGTAVAKADELRTISDYLNRAAARMNAVLPRHLTPERLARVAITAIQRSPRLLECSQESLALALLEAGQLGLEPNGVLGQAYLIPRRNGKTGKYEAQFQPGYRGLIDLARRSGEVTKVEARAVREGDGFEFEYGLKPKLVHRPRGGSTAALQYVYAVAYFRPESGVEPQFEVMDIDQVEAIRKRSASATDGPWVTDYEAMALKTVIKRLCKLLPLSPEAQAVLEADSLREAGKAVSIVEGGLLEVEEDEAEEEPETRTESVRGKIARAAAAASEEDHIATKEDHVATLTTLLQSEVVTDKERKDYLAPPLTQEEAAERVAFWMREIRARKAVLAEEAEEAARERES